MPLPPNEWSYMKNDYFLHFCTEPVGCKHANRTKHYTCEGVNKISFQEELSAMFCLSFCLSTTIKDKVSCANLGKAGETKLPHLVYKIGSKKLSNAEDSKGDLT